MTSANLQPVTKAEVLAELDAERPRAGLPASLRREIDRTLARWWGIAADDRPRWAREMRQIAALAEPVTAALKYRGNLLRQGLDRAGKVAHSGLGEAQTAELMSRLAELDPARLRFEMALPRRLFARLPGVGSRYGRWLKRCRSAEGEVAQLGERMVAEREPFKHTVARLARNLRDLRGQVLQLHEHLAYARARAAASARRADTGEQPPEQAGQLARLNDALNRRVESLQATAIAQEELLLAAEVLVRNARRLIGGQRLAVSVVREALAAGARLVPTGEPDQEQMQQLVRIFADARAALAALADLRVEMLAEMAALAGAAGQSPGR